MKRSLAILLGGLLALLLASCDPERVDPAFLEQDGICLQVNRQPVFQYDPLTCQLGYNPSRGEFRVSTDTMSDYYIVTLPFIPTRSNTVVHGDILWTGESSVKRYRGIDFKVARIEEDRIWLWNSQNKIAVTIQVLY